MNDVHVRSATRDDAAAIEAVGRGTWPSTYEFAGAEYIERGLQTWWSEEAVLRGIETTKTFVAEVGGAMVGMGNIDLRPEKPVIWKLYVLPEHHGVGAGHALIMRLLAEARDRDVLLEYVDGNARAAEFYRRHGFVELRRETPAAEGWPDEVWMVRKPDAS